MLLKRETNAPGCEGVCEALFKKSGEDQLDWFLF